MYDLDSVAVRESVSRESELSSLCGLIETSQVDFGVEPFVIGLYRGAATCRREKLEADGNPRSSGGRREIHIAWFRRRTSKAIRSYIPEESLSLARVTLVAMDHGDKS